MRYGLLQCAAVTVAVLGATTARAVDADAVGGVWHFDEGSGDVVADASTSGNDGTLVGSPEWVGGHDGDGLRFAFDDANYALVPVSHSNAATVMMWALYTGIPTGNIGLVHAQATEGDLGAPDTKMIGVWLENSNLLWGRIIDPAGALVNLPKNAELQPDTWFHIALVVDAAAGKVSQWVDGSMVGEADYGGELGEFAFLKLGRQGTETWEGILDEVGYFTEALSQDDITGIMDAGLQSVTTAVEARGKAATAWGAIKGDTRADAAVGDDSDR
jgi:hypothetical protein